MKYFQSTMGVHQGCLMLPLLFSLYPNRAVQHIHQLVESRHMVQVGNMNMAAALYTDDVVLLAPAPTSL